MKAVLSNDVKCPNCPQLNQCRVEADTSAAPYSIHITYACLCGFYASTMFYSSCYPNSRVIGSKLNRFISGLTAIRMGKRTK